MADCDSSNLSNGARKRRSAWKIKGVRLKGFEGGTFQVDTMRMTGDKEKTGLGQNGFVDKESVEVKKMGNRSFEASRGLE